MPLPPRPGRQRVHVAAPRVRKPGTAWRRMEGRRACPAIWAVPTRRCFLSRADAPRPLSPAPVRRQRHVVAGREDRHLRTAVQHLERLGRARSFGNLQDGVPQHRCYDLENDRLIIDNKDHASRALAEVRVGWTTAQEVRAGGPGARPALPDSTARSRLRQGRPRCCGRAASSRSPSAPACLQRLVRHARPR